MKGTHKKPEKKSGGWTARAIDDLPLDPVIEAYKRDIDRTLLRENLKRTVEERFLALMELQQFAIELRRAGQNARR